MEFVRPLLGSYSHFKVILAHSSGEGINEHHKTFFKEVKDSGAVKVTLCNFSEAEAQTYCDKFNLHIPLNDLKEKTNFNPYLLHAATQAKKAHWKDKYDQVISPISILSFSFWACCLMIFGIDVLCLGETYINNTSILVSLHKDL